MIFVRFFMRFIHCTGNKEWKLNAPYDGHGFIEHNMNNMRGKNVQFHEPVARAANVGASTLII